MKKTQLTKNKLSKKVVRNKALTEILKKHSGRSSSGTVSVRHQGGRQKRLYRFIDFKRAGDSKGTVLSIEYDPNRSAHIALVDFGNDEKRYMLAPHTLKVGSKVSSGKAIDAIVGNTLPLSDIPLGTEIHNIELYPGRGGQLVKSAGTLAIVVAKDDKYADIKLPSKEIRKILLTCLATVGRISNIERKHEVIGKAGRARLMGIRPTVRGVAQNPRSHPHGGGEGKTGEAMHPKTRQGKSARGTRTRDKKKWSKKLIVKRRKP